MDIDKKSKEYEICACRHITRGQVEEIIKAQHIKDLKELCQVANIGNKCGGCREMLDQLLAEINE